MDVADKVSIITAAASGIGKATARRFAELGARVILLDINEAALTATAKDLAEAGYAAQPEVCDITNQATVQAMVRRVLEQRQRIDVLVNAVGWGNIEPFLDGTLAYWQKLIQLNLMGTLIMTHAVLPSMLARQSGSIVNLASDAGRVGSLGETVYAAAKGGVIAFTKSLAREVSRHGILVNCISPGPTDTPLLREHAGTGSVIEKMVKAIPMRRIAQPEELANAIAFMASRQNTYITGQVLSVSGGLTMSG